MQSSLRSFFSPAKLQANKSEEATTSPSRKRRREEAPSSKDTEDKENGVVAPSPKRRKVGSATSSPACTPTKKSGASRAVWTWLDEGNIRDAEGRRPGDPNYDPTTLFIPQCDLDAMTASERQYWQAKSQHFDTLVAFRLGTFYEFYGRDADIVASQLGCKITTRANTPNPHMYFAGVPAVAFDLAAAELIARGFKVARVDENSAKRAKCNGKEVAERTVARVFTAGTLLDDEYLRTPNAVLLLAIAEAAATPATDAPVHLGVCIVDAASGHCVVDSVDDDTRRTELETLLARYPPREVVFPRGRVSTRTLTVIRNAMSTSATLVPRMPERQFWEWQPTVAYFTELYGAQRADWPAVLRTLVDTADTGDRDSQLALSALGGAASYLYECKIAREVLSLKHFRRYADISGDGAECPRLVLDGRALAHLEILENSYDRSTHGTLLRRVDHCLTAFGKRLLRRWLCGPLRHPVDIHDRLDAIDDILGCYGNSTAVAAYLERMLAGLPDLERKLARIFARSCNVYEFVAVREAFQRIWTVVHSLNSTDRAVVDGLRSTRLRRLLTTRGQGDGLFPDLEEAVRYWTENFAVEANADVDTRRGVAAHVLVPTVAGVWPEYDAVFSEWQNAESALAAAKAARAPAAQITALQSQHDEAEAKRKTVLQGSLHFCLEIFTKHFSEWSAAVECVAEVDCLRSLAKASLPTAADRPMCRPVFVDSVDTGGSYLELRGCHHPCIDPPAGTPFVANDVLLGNGQPAAVLLTGPNMGGKSTLLRQVCVAMVMAQLGCYVPAEYARMTSADRIFTRAGAADRLMAGASTFMVELEEASSVLRRATVDSLVAIDELGRGTSTFDGYAVAYAVLRHLTRKGNGSATEGLGGCRMLFSTHYHALADAFMDSVSNGTLALCHMACEVVGDSVVFYHKLTPGVCPRSYGMYVARAAGVPEDIIRVAEEAARKMEAQRTARERERKAELLFQLLGEILSAEQTEFTTLRDRAAEVCANT